MTDIKATTQRFYELFNAGDIDAIMDFVADDFVEHEEFPGLPPTKEGVRQFFDSMRAAFPDIRFDIEDIIAEGETIAARVRIRGTHRGEFIGIPATGKQVDIPAIDMVRFRDGKVVEHWGVTDSLQMMQQLGVAEGAPA